MMTIKVCVLQPLCQKLWNFNSVLDLHVRRRSSSWLSANPCSSYEDFYWEPDGTGGSSSWGGEGADQLQDDGGDLGSGILSDVRSYGKKGEKVPLFSLSLSPLPIPQCRPM